MAGGFHSQARVLRHRVCTSGGFVSMLERGIFPNRPRVLGAVVITVWTIAIACRAQNPSGLIQSDQWIALGPFSLAADFDCDAGDPALFRNYIAPTCIENLVPEEGDEIVYDTTLAAT